MNFNSGEKQSNIIFQRKGNIVASILQYYKNSFILWGQKIKFTPTLILFIIILLSLLIWVFVITFPAILEIILFLVPIFIFIELISFYLVRKTSKIYELKSMILKDDEILVSYRNSSQDKVLYQNILRLFYSGFYTYLVTGGNIFFWRMHYCIEYQNTEGEKKKLLVPLDLPNLPKFLKIITEKAGLIKIKPSKLSLVFEWRKSIPGENLKTVEINDLKVGVINPNLDLGKIPLVIGILIIIFGGWILWGMLTKKEPVRSPSIEIQREIQKMQQEIENENEK